MDNTQTGSTLAANGLEIVGDLMHSSTRLYANPKVFEDPKRWEQVERLVLLLKSVLEARKRVVIEANVPRDQLESVISVLPCMREPTIAPLHGEAGYSVKVAVPKTELAKIIPEIKARGGADIIVSALRQIVP